jgi:hypothetical protein
VQSYGLELGKKEIPPFRVRIYQREPGEGSLRVALADLQDLTIANAGRAHTDALGSTLDEGTHRLQVDVPAAVGHVMSVTDPVAELRTATTHFANSRHKTEIS